MNLQNHNYWFSNHLELHDCLVMSSIIPVYVNHRRLLHTMLNYTHTMLLTIFVKMTKFTFQVFKNVVSTLQPLYQFETFIDHKGSGTA